MLVLDFNPFPNLSTERLVLNQITMDDKEDLLVLRSNQQVMKYIPRPLAKTLEDAAFLIETMYTGINNTESINWGIRLKPDNKLIGIIGFVKFLKPHYRAEVGYLLHPNFQRMGIMQEALTAVINYGFNDLKLHSIEAIIDPRNASSAGILEKNNFVKEAYFKECFFFDGVFLDSVYYSRITPILH